MNKQKRILPILFVTLLLDMVGIGMVLPIIPILFTDPSSSSFLLHGYTQNTQYLLAGVVTALFGLMQFFAAPILGELSDVYGRKRLLILGVAVLAVSQLLFGFAVEIASLALIFVSRAIAGLAAANFSIAQASIADVSEPKNRAQNFGLIGAAFGIGLIIGPVLSGWIVSMTGNAAAPFWFAGIVGILNVLFISLFLPETRREKSSAYRFNIFKGIQNIHSAFLDVDARPLYLSSFLYVSGFSFFISFIGIFLVSRFGFSASSMGIFFGAVGGWIVLTQLFILRILSKKYSERSILYYSLLVLASTLLIYPFVPSSPLLYMLIPFIAIPQGLSIANMGSLISKSVSAEKQGAALGINGSLFALAQGVIPVMAGLGSGTIGIQAPFLAGGILVVLAWANLFIFSKVR
jgi:DHA1 family tetracycline resistance protein-like MFS transporter